MSSETLTGQGDYRRQLSHYQNTETFMTSWKYIHEEMMRVYKMQTSGKPQEQEGQIRFHPKTCKKACPIFWTIFFGIFWKNIEKDHDL